tara:strand:- start:13163 stop:13660 length:498 start_codon:yes stop_codon:yes gene_type:complete
MSLIWNEYLVWNFRHANGDQLDKFNSLFKQYDLTPSYTCGVAALAVNQFGANVGHVFWPVKFGKISAAEAVVVLINGARFTTETSLLFDAPDDVWNSRCAAEMKSIILDTELYFGVVDLRTEVLRPLITSQVGGLVAPPVKAVCMCPIQSLWGLGHDANCPEKTQ